MDSHEIEQLYRIIKDGFDNSDWTTIESGIDFICEFLEDDILQ